MLEIDHLNSYVWLKTAVVAFFHHVESDDQNRNEIIHKIITTIPTFLSRKSSKVNNISRSQRDFPKVFTDEPNGRQTVSTKILPNASTKKKPLDLFVPNKLIIHLPPVKQQKI